jgi:hypothetical protein
MIRGSSGMITTEINIMIIPPGFIFFYSSWFHSQYGIINQSIPICLNPESVCLSKSGQNMPKNVKIFISFMIIMSEEPG